MARAIVLGAGIVGASTAFHLARAGHEVVVVDAGLDGAATDAGAGIICAVGVRHTNAELTEFAAGGVGYYLDVVAQLEELGHADHSYGPVGQLILATDPADEPRLQAVAEVARDIADRYGTRGMGSTELIDGPTARQLSPVLGPVERALWLPAVARLDGRRFRDRLLDAAVGSGTTLVRDRARLVCRGGRVTGVATSDGDLGADVVVLAAGAWATEAAAEVGLTVPVRPQRGQIFHASLPAFADVPVAIDMHTYYLLSFPGGRIVCGATREDGAGFDHALTVGGITQTLGAVARFAPGIADARWIEGRVGFRPFSQDGLPILGVSERVENLVIGTGLGSSGLTAGPLAGALLAQLATGHRAAAPAVFSPDRFTA